MEQNSRANRLHALDGLRGIAILMVFLSHINATFISRSGLFGSTLFTSGVIGVSFLFILSGFLMSYLYPQPKSSLAFLQKRYTRIFPLFLAMCTTIFLLRLIAAKTWYANFGILLLVAFCFHVIWVYGIKHYFSNKLKKLLFISFILLQILVGIFYLWVMQHPATYYYDQMPLMQKALTNWFVNATLVLPIGKYVEMFDPVYWSLAAEVLFYILYPVVCAPVITYMSNKSKKIKIIFLICLFFFFGSITILSQHVLYTSLLRFQLFYYFITGMTLGYIYRKYPEGFTKIGNLFSGILSSVTLVLFFGFIVFLHLPITYPVQEIWKEMFLAIPSTLLLCIALANTTALAKFLRSKVLVFIGTISYSLYLSHMLVLTVLIDITKQPHTVTTTLLYIFLTLFVAILLSSILYYLLEKPYFMRTKTEKEPIVVPYTQAVRTPWILTSIGIGFLVVVFFVYQSESNFFSIKENFHQQKIISLRQSPETTFEFTATHDNLGLLSLSLLHESVPGIKFVPQIIEVRIKEKNATQWYSTTDYAINQPTALLPTLYGFPIITSAKGKTYDVAIVEKNPSSSEYITLDTRDNTVGPIFFVDKKSLIKSPQEFFGFIANKFLILVSNFETQRILLFASPFLFFVLYEFAARKKINLSKLTSGMK